MPFRVLPGYVNDGLELEVNTTSQGLRLTVYHTVVFVFSLILFGVTPNKQVSIYIPPFESNITKYLTKIPEH